MHFHNFLLLILILLLLLLLLLFIVNYQNGSKCFKQMTNKLLLIVLKISLYNGLYRYIF